MEKHQDLELTDTRGPQDDDGDGELQNGDHHQQSLDDHELVGLVGGERNKRKYSGANPGGSSGEMKIDGKFKLTVLVGFFLGLGLAWLAYNIGFGVNGAGELDEDPVEYVDRVESMTIFVLATGNNTKSLENLFSSLRKADYVGDDVNLEIIFDGEQTSTIQKKSLSVAERFSWVHGRKNLTVLPMEIGLDRVILEAWKPTSAEHKAVFLDENVAVSPLFYRWLKVAWNTYGYRKDIAGVSLAYEPRALREVSRYNLPFGYNHVGKHGFSPSHNVWKAYLEQQANKTSSAKSGRGEDWTKDFDAYCKDNMLFTIYLNPGDGAMATDLSQSKSSLFVPLIPQSHWREAWMHPPRKLPIYSDFYDHENTKLGDEKLLTSTKSLLNAKEQDFSALLARVNEAKKDGVVVIQLLNQAFIELTKNWICNVKDMEGVLERTLFVCTDHEAFVQMHQFAGMTGLDLKLHAEPLQVPDHLTFGRVGYYMMMLFRTSVLKFIVDNDVSLFLTEADATWFHNPYEIVAQRVKEKNADLVFMSDNYMQPEEINGGFIWIQATKRSKETLSRLYALQKRTMRAISDRTSSLTENVHNSGNEQKMWMETIKQVRKSKGIDAKRPALKVEIMKWDQFASGQWFHRYDPRPRSPVLILNNWAVSNANKKKRVESFGWWWLQHNQAECLPVPKVLDPMEALINSWMTPNLIEEFIVTVKTVEQPGNTVFMQLVDKTERDYVHTWIEQTTPEVLNRTLFVFRGQDSFEKLTKYLRPKAITLPHVYITTVPFASLPYMRAYYTSLLIRHGISPAFQSARFGKFVDPAEILLPSEQLFEETKTDVLVVSYDPATEPALVWFKHGTKEIQYFADEILILSSKDRIDKTKGFKHPNVLQVGIDAAKGLDVEVRVIDAATRSKKSGRRS